jgi:hypothetical protein
MEEDIKGLDEIERKEAFIKEYNELRKKYGVDFALEVKITPEAVNIPK